MRGINLQHFVEGRFSKFTPLTFISSPGRPATSNMADALTYCGNGPTQWRIERYTSYLRETTSSSAVSQKNRLCAVSYPEDMGPGQYRRYFDNIATSTDVFLL